jgi:hypothetical protein
MEKRFLKFKLLTEGANGCIFCGKEGHISGCSMHFHKPVFTFYRALT